VKYTIFILFLCSNLFSQQEFSLPELNEQLTQIQDNLSKIDPDLLARNDSIAIKKQNKEFESLSETYLLLGDYEEENNKNHDKAFEYYRRSLEYSKVVGDSSRYYLVKDRIANQFRNTGQYEEALSNFDDVIGYYKRVDDKSNLARTYLDVAKCHGENESLEDQSIFLNRARKVLGGQSDSLFYIEYLFEKIRYFESLAELDSTLQLAQTAYDMSSSLEHTQYQSKALYVLGFNLSKVRSYRKSIELLNTSLELLGNTPLEPLRLNIFRILSDSYSEIGDYNNAFKFARNYSDLNDSLLSKTRIEAINNLTFKYDSREKNNEIKILEKENEIAKERNEMQKRALYILAVGLILTMVTLYFIVEYYRQRIKANRIINNQREEINERKINDLQSNLKINTMQSMIEGQELERERIAKDLHDSLGGLLSTIKLQFEKAKVQPIENDENFHFQNAQDLLDTAVDEVRNISRNLQPGSLKNMGLVAATNDLINRYTGKAYPDIDFQHYHIPEKLNGMVATSIYRIIQELMNNAIKYAKASEIILQLQRVDDEIIISFEDDGIGFDAKNPEHVGMGLENVKSRVQYLKGNLQIDSQKDVGTSYLIHVKHESV